MSSSGVKTAITMNSTGDVDVRKLVVDIKGLDGKSAPQLLIKKGESAMYYAVPNIHGGEFKWTASGGISTNAGGESDFIPINADSTSADATLKIEYTLDDVTAVKTIKIAVIELQIVECPEYFAPSAEECLIKFNLGSPEIKLKDKARVVILDKNGDEVLNTVTYEMDMEDKMEYFWEGKNSYGDYIDILMSPFKLHIEHADSPDFRSEEREIKVEIESIEVTVDGIEEVKIGNESFDAVDMSDHDNDLEVSAAVKIKKSDGSGVATELPIELTFSFEDSSGENLKEEDSYYSLGKKASSTAEYWRQHVNYATMGYNIDNSIINVNVKTEDKSDRRKDKGIARTMFLPSGAGGDRYILKAALMDYSVDEGKAIAEGESDEFTVIRKVNMKMYEMAGVSHVSDNATIDTLHKYYDKDTFVLYEATEVVKIDAKYSVDYIGLWQSGQEGKMFDWSEFQKRIPEETPSAETRARAMNGGHPEHDAAFEEVTKMAKAWQKRINKAYYNALDSWAADAGIPEDSLVGIKFIHPKYTDGVPDSEAVTNEWRDHPAIVINVKDRDIHPDSRWGRVQGVSYNSRAYIISGLDEDRFPVVIAHEIGHETVNHFKRKDFGEGDHSSSAGLMDTIGSEENFSDLEKVVLRGGS